MTVYHPAIIHNKVALIMGIANQRSIAWSCMEQFLQRGWDVIYTVQNDKTTVKVERMIQQQQQQEISSMSSPSTIDGHHFHDSRHHPGSILGGFACDVTDDVSMKHFFEGALPELLLQQRHRQYNPSEVDEEVDDTEKLFPELHAVIHSLAFAPNLKTPLLQTTKDSFLQAHEVSSYSFIQVAKASLPYLRCYNDNKNTEVTKRITSNIGGSSSSISCCKSLTTLSYLGSVRAIPGYHVMGPAKASLESVVRGLALELGNISSSDCSSNNQNHQGPDARIRVNAVRAGPLSTISSKGGIVGFERMRQDVHEKAPLGNVTASQVASTLYHVAAEASGMTGQTINVDGGYSIVAGPNSFLSSES